MNEAICFDWDQANVKHISRHNVTLEEVRQVFANDPQDVAYEVIEGEHRYTVIGHTREYRVLVIIWTVRNGAVRAITAREASKRGREKYFRSRREFRT